MLNEGRNGASLKSYQSQFYYAPFFIKAPQTSGLVSVGAFFASFRKKINLVRLKILKMAYRAGYKIGFYIYYSS